MSRPRVVVAAVLAVLVLAVVATVILAGVLTHLLGQTSRAVRRLADDVTVIVDANISHRPDPAVSEDLQPLTVAVNRLAEARESAVARAAGRAAAGRPATA